MITRDDTVGAPGDGVDPLDGTPAGGPTEAWVADRWELHSAQRAFVRGDTRFSFYVGGVGAGKTFAGAVRALRLALDLPGSLGLVGAPTYPMLRDTTQRQLFALLDELREAFPGWEHTHRKVDNHLILPNGSEILLRTTDEPDRLRGLNLAWFWLDEAPLCGHYVWQILKGRLRQQPYGEVASGAATGTPHGRDGFWRDFEHAPLPRHALYRAATMANAAHLPAHYVEDLGLGESGAAYEQEVLGLFTAFAGLVYDFRADELDGHVRELPPHVALALQSGQRAPALQSRDGTTPDRAPALQSRDAPLRVIGGVDWGYANPTAAAVFALDGDDRAWQLDEFYQRRAPLQGVVLPALVDLTRRYGVSRWYCGPDEPEHIAALNAALVDAGLAGVAWAVPALNAVRAGIQTVTAQLARRGDGTRGLYVAPCCVHTIAEYGAYQYESPPPDAPAGFGERAASEAPVKANDHALDATRYALHSALGPEARSADAWITRHVIGRARVRAEWAAGLRGRIIRHTPE